VAATTTTRTRPGAGGPVRRDPLQGAGYMPCQAAHQNKRSRPKATTTTATRHPTAQAEACAAFFRPDGTVLPSASAASERLTG
jgi:hypothetical protein